MKEFKNRVSKVLRFMIAFKPPRVSHLVVNIMEHDSQQVIGCISWDNEKKEFALDPGSGGSWSAEYLNEIIPVLDELNTIKRSQEEVQLAFFKECTDQGIRKSGAIGEAALTASAQHMWEWIEINIISRV